MAIANDQPPSPSKVSVRFCTPFARIAPRIPESAVQPPTLCGERTFWDELESKQLLTPVILALDNTFFTTPVRHDKRVLDVAKCASFRPDASLARVDVTLLHSLPPEQVNVDSQGLSAPPQGIGLRVAPKGES
jgi:hypothetical protein